MRGRRKPSIVLVRLMNWRSISSVAMKSAITPSRSGRIVSIASGVRPTIFLAVMPTAMTSRMPLRLEIATTDGSLMMTPRPWTWTSVLAVPRSIEMSSENALPTPESTATARPRRSLIIVVPVRVAAAVRTGSRG